MKKKNIILGIIITLLIVLIGITIFLTIKLKGKREIQNSVNQDTLSNIIGEPTEKVDNVTEFIQAP